MNGKQWRMWLGVMSIGVISCGATQAMLTTTSEQDRQSDDEVIEGALTDMAAAINFSALDSTVSPCDDFYRYACGGYLAQHPVTDDWDYFSHSFDGASNTNTEALTELIKEASVSPIAEDQKVTAYFQSCRNLHLASTYQGKLPYLLASELAALRIARQNGGVSGLLGRSVRATSNGRISRDNPIVRLSTSFDLNGDRNQVYLFVGAPLSSRVHVNVEDITRRL